VARVSAELPDRDVLLIRMNHSNAGFFAQVQFAVNQIRYAEAKRMVPVVYFGADSVDGPNAYYEESAGPNVWEYYFEPVAGLTLEEAHALVRHTGRRLRTLSYWELWRLHYLEPRSVFTYPYGYYREIVDQSTHLDARWWAAQREKGRRLVHQYVHVRPEIAQKVQRFAAERFAPTMLGVHIRGTDKQDVGSGPALARIVPADEYFPHIDAWLQQHPQGGVFLATDQLQFRDDLARRYGDRVVWYSEMLSTSDVNVFQMQASAGRGNRAKGEEVLVDALLLSRCDRLLKCTSAVGEFAQYFADSLPAFDLNFVGVDERPRRSPRRAARRLAMRSEIAVRRVVADARGLTLEDVDQPRRPREAPAAGLPVRTRGHLAQFAEL
jgi:hypothetical protein